MRRQAPFGAAVGGEIDPTTISTAQYVIGVVGVKGKAVDVLCPGALLLAPGGAVILGLVGGTVITADDDGVLVNHQYGLKVSGRVRGQGAELRTKVITAIG